jgi:DedD protein
VGGEVSEAPQPLTFYKTLTAPTVEVPATTAPTVEERMVRDHGAEAPAPAEEPVAGASGPRATKGSAAKSLQAPRRTEPAAAPSGGGRAGTAAAAPATGADAELWTVQVSSFKNRALAEELRTQLVGRGLDAYIVSISSEEGRVRHRVRVGRFTTRAEAERVATDLRTERGLNPFVTTRTR